MNQDEARSILINHSRSSRNGIFPAEATFSAKITDPLLKELPDANRTAQGTNPICGDFVELKIHSDGVRLHDIGYKAVACSICSASSSLLCQEIKGLEISEVQKLSEDFESILLANLEKPWPATLANFLCFEHLRVNPARKACALLPWVTLKSALKTKNEVSL